MTSAVKDIEEVKETKHLQTLRANADVIERKEDILVIVDLPGVSKDDINVSVEKNVLTVTGKTKDATAQYKRAFTLTDNVDGASLSGKFNSGVLKLTVAKIAEAKVKKIEIK